MDAAMNIRILAFVIGGHRINDRSRLLRSRRVVEVYELFPVNRSRKNREILADLVHIEAGRFRLLLHFVPPLRYCAHPTSSQVNSRSPNFSSPALPELCRKL